eukprot:4588166-Pleurochrysis_carterae.AAC.1
MAIGVLRDSYIEKTRFRRVLTGIPQHSGRNHSTAVVLPNLYPHDSARLEDGRRSRPICRCVHGVVVNVFTSRYEP